MRNNRETTRAAYIKLAAFLVIFIIATLIGVKLQTYTPRLIPWLLALGLAGLSTLYLTFVNYRGSVAEIIDCIKAINRGDSTKIPDLEFEQLDLGDLNRAAQEISRNLMTTKQELESSDNELGSIIDGLVDGLIVVNEDLTVKFINRAASRMLSIRDKNPAGKYLWEVARNYNLVQAFNDAMEGEHHVEVEVRLYSPRKTLRAHTNPIKSDGKITGGVAVLHDITDIRRLEQVRTDFVANVSHELRTPITSIKGFVETLLDGAMDNPDDLRHFLQIIERDTNRMVNIVNDLLELSRIESAGQDLPQKPVDIAPIVKRNIEALQEKAGEKNIELRMELPGKPLVISGDEGMIGQVVFNLVDNAIKYTKPNGWVKVFGNQLGDIINFVVEDTGIGIAERHLERVFERFYRVDKGRSRQMGGTGLGLSIVKHIVEKHSGTISVESQLGEGTRFLISLPIYRGEQQPKQE